MRVQALDGGSAAHALFGADAVFARSAALMGIGAWTCDLTDSAIGWTSGIFDLFGLSPADAIDRRDTVALYDEESREAMERLRTLAILQGRAFTMEARIVRPDGERRWMKLSADVVRKDGRTTRLFGLKQDITEERLRWDALRQLAEHDALTGLTSRAIYQSRFLDAPRAQPVIAPLGALVLFDLDGFKLVNDQFGHAAGDACLRAFAQRLKAAFPDAPMIARIGGDEFAVLTGTDLSPLALGRHVRRLIAGLTRPIAWRGHLLTVGASAGIAPASDPWRYDAETLFALADEELYAAKAAGRGVVRIGRRWNDSAGLAIA